MKCIGSDYDIKMVLVRNFAVKRTQIFKECERKITPLRIEA